MKNGPCFLSSLRGWSVAARAAKRLVRRHKKGETRLEGRMMYERQQTTGKMSSETTTEEGLLGNHGRSFYFWPFCAQATLGKNAEPEGLWRRITSTIASIKEKSTEGPRLKLGSSPGRSLSRDAKSSRSLDTVPPRDRVQNPLLCRRFGACSFRSSRVPATEVSSPSLQNFILVPSFPLPRGPSPSLISCPSFRRNIISSPSHSNKSK